MDGSALSSCWHNLTALHINIILYLGRKVFLFLPAIFYSFFFFHFSNFQKLSSYLILWGRLVFETLLERWCMQPSLECTNPPLFLLILLGARAANTSPHFWCFRRVIRKYICLLASKLLMKFLS